MSTINLRDNNEIAIDKYGNNAKQYDFAYK